VLDLRAQPGWLPPGANASILLGPDNRRLPVVELLS